MSRALQAWLGALALALVSGSAAVAAAQTKRVVVMEFEGPSAGAARAQVVASLSDQSEVEVVSVKEANAAASRLSLSLTHAGDLQKIAAELEVSAFIEGNVEKEGKNLRVLVRVRNASTGEVVHEEPFVRKKPQLKTIKTSFWKVMKPHILATEVPAKPKEREPEPEPAPRASFDEESTVGTGDEEPAEEPSGPKSTRFPALVAWIGPRLMWRSLSYEGATGLSSYKNDAGSPGFNLALGAVWYPGAHSHHSYVARNLGVEGAFEYTIGLKSNQNGQELSTTAYELDVNAIMRFPLDTFEPRVRLGYMMHTFQVPDSNDLPGVTYSGVRVALGSLMHLGDALSFDIDLGPVIVFSTGDIDSADFATGTSAFAFEAGAGGTYRFGDGTFGARLAVDYRRYFLSVGCPAQTGGQCVNETMTRTLPSDATDGYFRMTMAFVYTMAGVP